MPNPTAKILLCILALTVAVPESYARRLGGGRSVGRQAPISRQRMEPMAPQRQALPGPQYAPPQGAFPYGQRQSLPPMAPQSVPRQAGSQWGGMLGGALLGLGLGSMLSSHDRNADSMNRNQNNGNLDGSGAVDGTNGNNGNNPTTGDSANGTSASGDGQIGQQAQVPGEAARQGGSGSFLWFGLLALAAFFIVRRLRRRS